MFPALIVFSVHNQSPAFRQSGFPFSDQKSADPFTGRLFSDSLNISSQLFCVNRKTKSAANKNRSLQSSRLLL